jgi:hypothetical protein
MTPPTSPTSLAARLAGWWFAPAPAERLAAVRILVGLFALIYLLAQVGPLWQLTALPVRSWEPVGPLVGLDGPLPVPLWRGLVIGCLALAAAFTAGAWYRVVAPLFAVVLLVVLSYRSSWGMIFHTENLLVVHVAILGFAPAADAWSIDSRGGRRGGDAAVSSWPLRAMSAVTVTGYLLAGIAKLRLGGVQWVLGDELRNQVAVDNLRKLLLGSDVSALATPLLEHPSLFAVMAAMTLVVELGAPVAMLGGRIAALWALAAWGFHLGVVLLMHIVFPYPLAGVAFVSMFAAERPLAWLLRRAGRGSAALTLTTAPPG